MAMPVTRYGDAYVPRLDRGIQKSPRYRGQAAVRRHRRHRRHRRYRRYRRHRRNDFVLNLVPLRPRPKLPLSVNYPSKT